MPYVFAGGAHAPVAVADPASVLLHDIPPDQQRLLTGNKVFITADSPEKLNAFLARISLMCNKPIDEIQITDLLRLHSIESLEFQQVSQDGNLYTRVNVSEVLENHTEQFNDDEYFLDEIPRFTPGTGTYLKSSFNSDWTGLNKDVGLAGLSGAAQALYTGNYGKDTDLPPVNIDSTSPVGKLLSYMFGPNTAFNQGHMNVLKMMGLVSGSAKADASTWRVTPDKGALIVAAIGDANQPKFIPSMALLQLPLDYQALAGGVSKYFAATGYAAGYSAEDVEKVASDVLNKGMGTERAPLPANLVIPQDTVGKLLNHLFKLGPENQVFTDAQINTAIAMGLITFSGAANSPTLATAEIGNKYLTGKLPPVTTPVSDPTPTLPTPEEPVQEEEPQPDEEEDNSYWYGNS